MTLRNIYYFQWKSYWRSFNTKRKTERRFFLLVFLLIPYFVGPAIRSLTTITRAMQEGITSNFEKLILLIFLSWFLLPLMANDSYLNITAGHLSRFPIPARKLFLLECFGVIIQPITWLITIGSLSLLVPLGFSSAPIINLISGLFFIAFSFFFSLFLKNFFYDGGILKKLFILFAITPVLYTVIFSPNIELLNRVLFTYPLPVLIVIIIFTILSAYLAYLSFTLKGTASPNPRGIRLRQFISMKKKEKILFRFIKTRGKTGGLLLKDFYYFFRSNNIFINLFIIILYIHYLLTYATPAVDSFFILLLFLFIPNINFALNSLGFDSASGMSRCFLCPLQGHEILLSKNLAFLSILFLQLLPVFVMSLVKLGAYILLLGILELFTTTLLLLFWGNIISVLQPVSVQIHVFNLFSLHTAIPFIIAIYIIHIGVFRAVDAYRENPDTAFVKQLLFLAVCFLLYLVSLISAGKKLDKNMEKVKEQLR